MKSLFSNATAALLVVVFAQGANAECIDKNGAAYPPVAISDADGNVAVRTPTGHLVRVGGLPPFTEVCRSLLFRTAHKKCPGGEAVLDDVRDPKFCKGVSSGNTCVHVRCNE